jgi:Double-GTPase 2
VKIVMLGYSGAGKTTYVSLMYAEMQEGVCGFRVRANDGAHHRQLMADAKAIRGGTYPAATHRRTSYDLVLSYNGSEVMPFSWRDHRGGAISGRTSDGQDVAELNQDLLDSDAIVMFIDGAELVNDPRAARMVGHLSSHILRALHSREELLIPLVIATTKCDLIDLGDARVRSALDAPLQELVSAIRASRHIQGTVMRISCGTSPVNVIQPVLFTLRFGVIGMGMRLAAAAQYYGEAAQAAASRDTMRDRITARRRRAQNSGSLAAQFRLNAERAYQDLLVLIPPAEGLDKLLQDVESF